MKQWRDKHRFRLQMGALLTGLVMPFVLYVGISNQLQGLELVAFAAITLSMGVVAWAG